jgi:NAD(P)-dependent dehydrogenase (short-subunit alcohol dehydrogenase family)
MAATWSPEERMMGFADRHVAVVGGSSGIGRAIAQGAVAAGARVTIASSGVAKREAAAAAIGARALALDIADPASVAAFAAALGPVDHLVVTAHSPASLGTIRPIAAQDPADATRVFAVKVLGTLAVVRAAAPHLARDGSILLVSGAAARRIMPGHVVLGAANAAVEAMGRQLARELAPVRVNVISPGLTRSEAYDPLPEPARAALFARAAALPVGRAGEPAEIAAAALALMDNAFCTGAVLDVDGGGLLVGVPG